MGAETVIVTMCYQELSSLDMTALHDVTTFCHSVILEYSEYLLDLSHLQNIFCNQIIMTMSFIKHSLSTLPLPALRCNVILS